MAALLFTACGSVACHPTDTICQSYTLFREAGGQSAMGKRAVLDVLNNRMMNSSRTCFQVVSERAQFSWYSAHLRFALSKQILDSYLETLYIPSVLDKRYEYFYSAHIAKPSWARHMRCVKIDGQYFCRKLGE